MSLGDIVSREFVSAIADAMAGKASFVDSDLITNFSPPQRISCHFNLVSFIVTSAQVIS